MAFRPAWVMLVGVVRILDFRSKDRGAFAESLRSFERMVEIPERSSSLRRRAPIRML